MGRHSAGDGSGVDPIVAAALRSRPAVEDPSTPRHGDGERPEQLTAADGEGGLGWPGEPGEGTGLGWPVDLVTGEVLERADPPAAPAADPGPVAVDVSPTRRRGGWRRLFGGAADDARRATSAA